MPAGGACKMAEKCRVTYHPELRIKRYEMKPHWADDSTFRRGEGEGGRDRDRERERETEREREGGRNRWTKIQRAMEMAGTWSQRRARERERERGQDPHRTPP